MGIAAATCLLVGALMASVAEGLGDSRYVQVLSRIGVVLFCVGIINLPVWLLSWGNANSKCRRWLRALQLDGPRLIACQFYLPRQGRAVLVFQQFFDTKEFSDCLALAKADFALPINGIRVPEDRQWELWCRILVNLGAKAGISGDRAVSYLVSLIGEPPQLSDSYLIGIDKSGTVVVSRSRKCQDKKDVILGRLKVVAAESQE
jgi:hypothetical protein